MTSPLRDAFRPSTTLGGWIPLGLLVLLGGCTARDAEWYSYWGLLAVMTAAAVGRLWWWLRR